MKTLKSRYVRYTVTAALPYANGPLHIGHLAGAYLPADIYARYLRLKGEDVVFVCGSDEHGAAITLRAKKEGVSPKEIVDKYHQLNKKTFEDFGIDFDIFHRTSSELHHKTAADFFKVLNDKDEFVQKTTEQYYDEEHQQFLADRYITGTCPKCDYGNAYGDQCEKCGSSLSPKELINPKSALSGNQPVLKETKHWYLPMDKYESWLKEWIIEGHKDDWKPNVFGQCKSWIEGGLKQRAMTRDLDWGVKVPLEGAEGKVLYVWLDAPIGYISATKQWAADNDKNWEDYWKDKDTKLVHFIGKDNIVFHCIIFPILLKAHGGFILPDNVPANEFLNLEGDKFSTSRNWAVWLYEYLDDFPEKQDVLRYVLCANAPEAKDNDFTWREFQSRNNNELVANLGNFVNRVATLVHKYYNGKVPEYNAEDQIMKDCANPTYRGHIEQLLLKTNQVNSYLEQYKFKLALHSLMEISAINGNLLLQENEPWKQIKTNPEHVKSVLNAAIQTVAVLSVLCQPFIPGTSSKIREILNLQPIQNGELKKLLKELRNENYIKSGHQLNKPELLFQKIEDWEIETQIQKLQKTKEKAQSINNIQ